MLKTSSHYVSTLLEFARNLGVDIDALIVEAGIPQDQLGSDDLWLDNSSLTILIKALWRESGDETMGIDPQPTRMGSWALVCDYVLSAETLGELYRRGQHITSYMSDTNIGINFSVDKKDATVEVLGYVGNRDPHHFLMEFLNVVWHRFACWTIGETIPLKCASFSYAAPGHEWFYDELFQCTILFSQPFCGFSFNKKYLSHAICRNRQELALWLRESPADLLYMPGRDNSVAHYIQRELATTLRSTKRFPAFDSICEDLHMSPQVVRRRLEEEGSSYQKLKDSVRSDLIKALLLNPDVSISEITERSGFTEVASLTRAFKKWTGVTPAFYREQELTDR